MSDKPKAIDVYRDLLSEHGHIGIWRPNDEPYGLSDAETQVILEALKRLAVMEHERYEESHRGLYPVCLNGVEADLSWDEASAELYPENAK